MNRYHIDAYNGLPSNHVYSTLVDKHGYLWICTDKGVVRYNGYEFKKFGLEEGLPNEDVWQMIEDKKGRIWLHSIADGIGYVWNNEYKKAYLKDSDYIIYSRYPSENNRGIMFMNMYGHDRSTSHSVSNLCIEINDTIYLFSLAFLNKHSGLFYFNRDTLLGIFDNIVFNTYVLNNKLINDTLLIYSKNLHTILTKERYNFLFNRRIITYNRFSDYIFILAPYEKKVSRLELFDFFHKNEKIQSIYADKGFLYTINSENIYKLDSNIRPVAIYPYRSYAPFKNEEITYFTDDSIWGEVISTSSNGVFIQRKVKETSRRVSIDLTNCKAIGTISDSISFWWNTVTKDLLKCKDGKIVWKKHDLNIISATKVVKYNNQYSLLFSKGPIYWLNNETGEIKDFFENITHYKDNYVFATPEIYKISYVNIMDGYTKSKDSIYFLSSVHGFCLINLIKDSVGLVSLDFTKHNALLYDSFLKAFWLYNDNEIMVYYLDGRKINFGKEFISSMGILKIEKLLIDDKNGNVFIKDHNKLFALNYKYNSYKQVFKNYNLRGAFIHLDKNVLIVMGKFGILCSKIEGNKIFLPAIYRNIKNEYYNFINDYTVVQNQIWLNTDKGTYLVKVPDTKGLSQKHLDNTEYKLLGLYGNSLRILDAADTLKMNQEDTRLVFDVINPNGNGDVHYSYSIDGGSWQELNANELTLSGLEADKYYKLSLVAHDDAWRSNKTDVSLYVIPYWWQTTAGKRILWISGFLIIALLGTIIALITRRIVQQNNEKKTSQLGLELNAIYSQINPHFVFNTLNTAQYFIKKKKTDEAFIHINKFSRLLRAYIKSARNKFITVDEELGNLTNYIELQQERFENRFDYQLIVDENEAIKDVKIPSLLLQPIVENAINHGIFHKEEKGHLVIKVNFGKNKNEIICVIDDDGIGRKRSKELHADSVVKRESFGDKLINDLINIFNKYEQVNIQLEYTDKEEPLTGTIVKLTIKNLQHDK